MKHTRGDAGVTVLVVIACVAVAGWFAPKIAPHWFDKRTKQADESAEVTQELQKAVSKEEVSDQKIGAAVAASVKVIGEAAAEAGDSPWAVFVAREAEHISPLLPPPDYKALYAAEARKRAVLEGKLELADKLYKEDARDKQKLLDENVKLQLKLGQVFAERRELDTKLAEAAAFARGKDLVISVLAIVCVLLGLLWLYAKLSGVSLRSLAVSVADIREGADPVASLDRILSLRQQAKIASIVSPNK